MNSLNFKSVGAALPALVISVIVFGHFPAQAKLPSASSTDAYEVGPPEKAEAAAVYDVTETVYLSAALNDSGAQEMGDQVEITIEVSDQIRINEILENDLSGERIIDFSVLRKDGFAEHYFAAEETLAASLTASDVASEEVAERLEQVLGVKVAHGSGWVAPVRARITSKQGMRRDPFTGVRKMHWGVDYAVPVGTPIKAAGTGRVNYAKAMNGYGKLVEICHPDGNVTRYAHLSTINVRVGAKINAGSQIAKSGNTGRSTKPHLHFEKRRIPGRC